MNLKNFLSLGLTLIFIFSTGCVQNKKKVISHLLNRSKPLSRPLHHSARLPFDLIPTDEQKKELIRLSDALGEKLDIAREKVVKTMTPEQVKARVAAAKKAAARGKRGQELIEAINREVPISPQQAQKLEEAQHHLKELSLEMNQKVQALLTPEQRIQISNKMQESVN